MAAPTSTAVLQGGLTAVLRAATQCVVSAGSVLCREGFTESALATSFDWDAAVEAAVLVVLGAAWLCRTHSLASASAF